MAVPLAFNLHTFRGYDAVKVTLPRSLVGVMALAWLMLIVEEHVRLAFTAHKSLGMMYFYYLGRMPKGVVHFERACALDPENAEAPLLRQVIDEYWKR